MTRPQAALLFALPLLLCCSIVLPLSPPALAQQPPLPTGAPADGVPLFHAEFGWSGQFPGDRWGPVTVWVEGGEDAFSGVLIAEHPQDSTQTARVSVPFATTPGKLTPVRFILALPTYCNRISFTLTSESGRALRTLTYAIAPTDTEALLRPLVPTNEGLLVAVGRTSLVEAARGWSNAADPIGLDPDRPRFRYGSQSADTDGPLSDAQLRTAWSLVSASRVEPAALPLAANAYDGVLALVVDADATSAADPRAIESVHQWVRDGGRLTIIASSPGQAWRAWLPPGPEGELVLLRPLQEGALPGDVKAAIDRSAAAAAAQARARLEDLQIDDPAPQDPLASEPIPSAAATVQRRLITLTPAAANDGWTLRWTDHDDPSAGALAEGPVGLGWVTVLGIDPQRTSDVLSTRASAAVWRDALTPAVSDWLRTSADPYAGLGWGGWNPVLGGRTAALGAALTSLADVPITRDSLFVAIAGAMALLALLVGPADYFLLRRFHARQRSWLTALLWISLASLAAYTAPELLRQGPTQVRRVTTTDRLVRPGDPPAAAAPQTGVTGIFAAESGRLSFTRMDPASWWRGVSGTDAFAERAPTGAALVATAQAPGSDARGNPLDQLGMGLWTFRTFMDHSRPTTSLNARVRTAPSGEGWRLTVVGLPQGATINGAVVRLAEHWILLGTDAPPADGRWETAFTLPAHRTVAPHGWDPRSTPQTHNPWASPDGPPPELRPSDALALAGPDRRTLAIDRRVATGRWACVQLHLKDVPSDIALEWPAEFKHTAVVRLVVPLEGDGAATPKEKQP